MIRILAVTAALLAPLSTPAFADSDTFYDEYGLSATARTTPRPHERMEPTYRGTVKASDLRLNDCRVTLFRTICTPRDG